VGNIEKHHQEGVFSFVVGGYRPTEAVLEYFDSNVLKTKKANSYRIWKEIRDAIGRKEHLIPDIRALLAEKSRTINN
jgi:hypothetical protein